MDPASISLGWLILRSVESKMFQLRLQHVHRLSGLSSFENREPAVLGITRSNEAKLWAVGPQCACGLSWLMLAWRHPGWAITEGVNLVLLLMSVCGGSSPVSLL